MEIILFRKQDFQMYIVNPDELFIKHSTPKAIF